MKIEVIKCPSCGANLDINLNEKMTECEYCGTQLLINDLKNGEVNKKVVVEESNEVGINGTKSTYKRTEYITSTENIDMDISKFENMLDNEEIINELKNSRTTFKIEKSINNTENDTYVIKYSKKKISILKIIVILVILAALYKGISLIF